MNEKTEKALYNLVKVIVHVAVVVISLLLTVNLFMGFSDKSTYKILYIVLAVCIELGKLYVFVLSKAYFKIKSYLKGFILATVYLGLMLVSLISNTGFSLASIQNQSKSAVIQETVSDTIIIDRELKQLDNDIEFLTSERNINRNKKEDLPTDWVVNRREIQAIIDSQTKSIEDKNIRTNEILLEKQRVLNKEVVVVSKSSDIFDLLGKEVNISGSTVMLILMLVISLLLELLTVITAGNYTLDNKNTVIQTTKEIELESSIDNNVVVESTTDLEPELVEVELPQPIVAYHVNKIEFISYIKALFSEGKDKLVQDTVISEMLDMKLSYCKQYRRKLQEMSYLGNPLIVGKSGVGTRSQYPLKTILKLVEVDTERKWN